MPFGQPIRFPTERRPCGCVVVKHTESIENVASYCSRHWKNLPAEKRAEIRRLQRKGVMDGAVTILLRLSIVIVLAYMGWTVYGALLGPAR